MFHPLERKYMECFQFHLCKSIKLVGFFSLFAVINLLFYSRIIRLWVSNATFKKYWLIKTEYSDKTVNLIQVTDTLYHIRLYRVHLVIRGHQINNCHADGHEFRCKSNYHAKTMMMIPFPLLVQITTLYIIIDDG